MKKTKSFQILIPIFLLALLSTACASSFDLSGQPETVIEPTSIASIEISAPTTEPIAPTNSPTPGSIRGKLSYPSEFIPPLRVVAFRVENSAWTQQYFYVDTNLNAAEYQINGLQAGFYWIVAYTIPNGEGAPVGLAGGYSQAVLCGLSADCTDHSLIPVEIKSGQLTVGVDPTDWYAPEGSFLPNPSP